MHDADARFETTPSLKSRAGAKLDLFAVEPFRDGENSRKDCIAKNL